MFEGVCLAGVGEGERVKEGEAVLLWVTRGEREPDRDTLGL